MRFALPLFALVLVAGFTLAADPVVDVGAVDQKRPKKEAVATPKKDDGLTTVDVRTAVKGMAAKGEKRTVYVLINPLGKKGDAPTYWWVQNEVTLADGKFTCDAQFGEEDAGSGEYFAVVAVATERKWSVGDRLDDLPDDAAFSKVTVVKRK
ncbi:MAG: hypothetical protein ABGY75_10865 [Gemmataceae bacterium]